MQPAKPEDQQSKLICQVCQADDPEPYTSHPIGGFVRCRNCGLVFSRQAFDPDALTEEHYDEAEFFDRYQHRRAHKVWSDSRRLDALMGFAPGLDHLDIGCGLGACVEAGGRRGLNSIGVDVGEYPVQFCRERGLDTRIGSMTETGMPDVSLDLVTAYNVLEHIPHTEDGLAEVRRILRPGGIFGFLIPNGNYLKAHLMRERHFFYGDLCSRVHYTYHTLHTIITLLDRSGFKAHRYPWLVTGRLKTPLGAVGELLTFLPRSILLQLKLLCRMNNSLLMIARKV